MPHHSCTQKGTARQEKPLKEGGSKREDGRARNAIMECGTVLRLKMERTSDGIFRNTM
jgi:hypothetical protein